MPPAAGGLIHELDDGRLARELAHVPQCGRKRFAAARLVVWAGGVAHRLAFNQQVHADLLGILAAADEETDELALDLELRRREGARCSVAIVKRIDQALAL